MIGTDVLTGRQIQFKLFTDLPHKAFLIALALITHW